MEVLSRRILYILATGSIALSAISGFQSEVLAAGKWYATHPSSSNTWLGDTEQEALNKCQTWAKRARKNPNKCETGYYGI